MNANQSGNGVRVGRRVNHSILIVVVLYLTSRLIYLGRLPVFVDEAIHIRWARSTLQGDLLAGWGDGKWLFTKVAAAFLLLPIDSVSALRLVSVCSGLITLAACIRAGTIIFDLQTGVTAGVFYALIPYTLFYDRLGLADGLSTAFGAVALALSVQLVRSDAVAFDSEAPTRADRTCSVSLGAVFIALSLVFNEWVVRRFLSHDGVLQDQTRTTIWIAEVLMGLTGVLILKYRRSLRLFTVIAGSFGLAVVLSASILSKANAMLLIVVPILAVLSFARPGRIIDSLIRISPALLVGGATSSFLLVMGGGTQLVQEKAALTELRELAEIWQNWRLVQEWFSVMLTPPVATAFVCGVLWIFLKNRKREDLFLISVLACTSIPYILTGKNLYSRYFLFTLVPISLILARLTVFAGRTVRNTVSGFLSIAASVRKNGSLSFVFCHSL